MIVPTHHIDLYIELGFDLLDEPTCGVAFMRPCQTAFMKKIAAERLAPTAARKIGDEHGHRPQSRGMQA